MVRIIGEVIKSFYCEKHQQANNLEFPELGIVRVRPSSLSFNETTYYNCCYTLNSSYLREIPIIDILYKLDNGSLLEDLVSGLLVEMEAKKKSFYYKPERLLGIKETEEGQIKFWNVNITDREFYDSESNISTRTISSVRVLSSLQNEGTINRVLSTKEFIRRLVPLHEPTLLNEPLPLDLFTQAEPTLVEAL